MLKRVTITGADNSVDPRSLADLSKEFPFVEWGILFSRKQKGPRWPSRQWFEELAVVDQHSNQLRLSLHLCGAVVRETLKGDFSGMLLEVPKVEMFQRVQLNTHGQVHEFNSSFISTASDMEPEFIFQFDEVNNELFQQASGKGFSALFDLSHGAGVLPENWPYPLPGFKCGYAGGLGPDNLDQQLQKIESLVGETPIWVDMETKVRTNDDQHFDVAKVRKCLEIAVKYLK
jgi:hypothetical protein